MASSGSDNTLSLSEYFGSTQNDINLPQTLSELRLDDSSLYSAISKSEPEVCRLFAETTNPFLKDSTASFFDVISPSSSGKQELDSTTDTPNNNFSSRVTLGTELDRRRDAWIPVEETRKILIANASAPAGTFVPDPGCLTMPGVLLEDDLSDLVGEAVQVNLGEAEVAQRRVLTANDVTQDERGLRELVQVKSYRSAINLTARLLTIYGQGRGRTGHLSKHSPHSLQLWFTRIALLVKIKAFKMAQAEVEPFGDLNNPDLFYQFYPEMYGGRSGSIASFSFRLLLAELPMYCNQAKKSLTKLFNLLSIIRQMLTNLKNGFCEDGNPLEITESDRTDSQKLWNGREERVMHSIINCALMLKEYELAMDLLGQLCDREGAPKATLLSALGRLHLQLGDVTSAEVCFRESKEARGGVNDVRDHVDKGLLAVAQNNFDDAYTCFQSASHLQPNNVMILNNMGVCLLYGGHLKQAIDVLESAIATNPVQALHESLLLNLCALYDMGSSKGRMKKFALLRQISLHQADAPANILEKLYG